MLKSKITGGREAKEKNMAKLVSIVLPTFNGEKFIKESIESVINQTYKNWELIIVNDCSKDNTLKIITDYSKIDSRIKIISNEKNLKLPASLNKGFSIANGEYYTWTSDDNIYKLNALEEMVKYLEGNPNIDLASFSFDYINENGDFEYTLKDRLPFRFPEQLAWQCNIGACFIYRREIAQKTGSYNIEMFCAEDYEYWCRIALIGNIAYSDKNLYKYRNNSQSLTAQKYETIYKKTQEIKLKYSLSIMNKYNMSTFSKLKRICKEYNNDKNEKWLDIAKSINPLFAEILKYTVKIISVIYSKVKTKDRNIYTIFGIKIKVNRKGKLKDIIKNYIKYKKGAKINKEKTLCFTPPRLRK